MIKFSCFTKKRKHEVDDVELRISQMDLYVESFPYVIADDGKDTVVNKHLQKRADQIEKMADRLEPFIRR